MEAKNAYAFYLLAGYYARGVMGFPLDMTKANELLLVNPPVLIFVHKLDKARQFLSRRPQQLVFTWIVYDTLHLDDEVTEFVRANVWQARGGDVACTDVSQKEGVDHVGPFLQLCHFALYDLGKFGKHGTAFDEISAVFGRDPGKIEEKLWNY